MGGGGGGAAGICCKFVPAAGRGICSSKPKKRREFELENFIERSYRGCCPLDGMKTRALIASSAACAVVCDANDVGCKRE
jgi:hypothetical protein